MNKFDQFVKHKLKAEYYIRYADDFVVLSENKKWLEDILPHIRDYLKSELQLELHPNKISISTFASGIDFLGWVHFPHYRVPRTTMKKRMMRNVRDKEGKEETVQSYLGLLSHGNTKKLQEAVIRLAENSVMQGGVNYVEAEAV